jgi:citrate synthase
MKVDQRGFSNQPSEFLSGTEAARLLGVKRKTLYAYASRGLLRSEPGGHGGKARVYRRSDMERLRARSDARAGHGAVAASALRFGEPVLDSALTDIRDGSLLYRGVSAIALAESDTAFEEVARFLWTGEPVTSRGGAAFELFDVARSSASKIEPKHLAALIPRGTPALPSLSLMAAAMGAQDLERFQAPLSAELPRAASIVKRLATALGVGDEPQRVRAALSAETVAKAALIALGARTSRAAARAVNRALVLIADHELNPSTFAVRVAASAGADLYACVSAGLATLSGSEHGGACDRVEALVAEAGRPERARAVVQDRTQRGEAIPGFGHRLYPSGGSEVAARTTRGRGARAEERPRADSVRDRGGDARGGEGTGHDRYGVRGARRGARRSTRVGRGTHRRWSVCGVDRARARAAGRGLHGAAAGSLCQSMRLEERAGPRAANRL